MRLGIPHLATALAFGMLGTAQAQWVEYVDVTDDVLVLDPLYAVNDNIEKDFEWGDFDKDGDIDLVVMRKFPGSVEGGARNLLLMNEDGMLVDYTDSLAAASDVVADGGFLALTNDRDVKAADVDGDGWLDLVTCTTMSDPFDAVIGQPRVYMNLGNNQSGQWRGFRFENNRIEQLFAISGATANPRACALDVDDLTGDGYPDIFFVDYDTPETSGLECIDLNLDGDTNDIVDGVAECNMSPGEDAVLDYNAKLLVNQGAANPGYFVDSGNSRMTAAQLAMGFGMECHIADMNRDGLNDVVRVDTLTSGQDIAIIYGNPANPGNSFIGPDTVTELQPYGMNIADLNNDGMIDIVTADDGQDAYLLNTGNGGDGLANFVRYTIPDSEFEFGNSVQFADLDNDGWLDCLIADVDADLPPFCPSSGRRMHIYHNTGVDTNLLDEQGLVLPEWALQSTYDAAPIDLNGDGWKDLVIGACYGISVFYNNPPIGVEFEYPTGVPEMISPNTTTDFAVEITPIGGDIVAGSALLWSSVNGGSFTSSPLTGGSGNYVASINAPGCGDSFEFYFSADLSPSGSTFRDPPQGIYTATVADGFEIVFNDDMESGTNGWTTGTDASVTFGNWELVDPLGTSSAGLPYAPDSDASGKGTMCWVTGQGQAGGSAGSSDLDGGPVTLTSPAINLDGGDATISFSLWFTCNDAGNPSQEDALEVQVSNGGGWQTVMTHSGQNPSWQSFSFNVGDYVTPSANTQVRFICSDNPNNSLTEAGVDDFRVERTDCGDDPCPGDLNNDGQIDGGDLGALLAAWNTAEGDLNGDGATDGADLGIMLTLFGTGC